ncbi:uncharacterized protein AMSG_05551 [Thecamonas trahens ATCC 50062]|uniref:Uncharacterized protein n=1 Tax=Thecamonas trahens ATCC 50062 TaxID=461836 RepID=A0A0L0DB20_THETB|nr:hypothetical protein AMSG_05551 [Thecamonas trahens ATCC 50062]KNC49527.1 hypothetical protein AMSG_05551 [Thecamonas trahens ATCC 50062]|eukprot:XP_013757642.1 hypothetical protein AMSG_05551 [Thecamonas trahens ATCC 50062]
MGDIAAQKMALETVLAEAAEVLPVFEPSAQFALDADGGSESEIAAREVLRRVRRTLPDGKLLRDSVLLFEITASIIDSSGACDQMDALLGALPPANVAALDALAKVVRAAGPRDSPFPAVLAAWLASAADVKPLLLIALAAHRQDISALAGESFASPKPDEVLSPVPPRTSDVVVSNIGSANSSLSRFGNSTARFVVSDSSEYSSSSEDDSPRVAAPPQVAAPKAGSPQPVRLEFSDEEASVGSSCSGCEHEAEQTSPPPAVAAGVAEVAAIEAVCADPPRCAAEEIRPAIAAARMERSDSIESMRRTSQQAKRLSRSSSFLAKYLADARGATSEADSADAELAAATTEIARLQEQNQVLIKQLVAHKLDASAYARAELFSLGVMADAAEEARPLLDLGATATLLSRRVHDLAVALALEPIPQLRASHAVVASLASQFTTDAAAWLAACPFGAARNAAQLLPDRMATACQSLLGIVTVVTSGAGSQVPPQLLETADPSLCDALSAFDAACDDLSAIVAAVQPGADLLALARSVRAAVGRALRTAGCEQGRGTSVGAPSRAAAVARQLARFERASARWAEAASPAAAELALPLHAEVIQLVSGIEAGCGQYATAPSNAVADDIEAMVADLHDAISSLTAVSSVACDSVVDVVRDFTAKLREWKNVSGSELQMWAYMLDSFAERTFRRIEAWAASVAVPGVADALAQHQTLLEGMLSELSLVVGARLHAPDSEQASDHRLEQRVRNIASELEAIVAEVRAASAGGPLVAAVVGLQASVDAQTASVLGRYQVRLAVPQLEAGFAALARFSRQWQLATEDSQVRGLVAASSRLVAARGGVLLSACSEFVANPTPAACQLFESSGRALMATLAALEADVASAPLLGVDEAAPQVVVVPNPAANESVASVLFGSDSMLSGSPSTHDRSIELPGRSPVRSRGGLLLEVESLRATLSHAEAAFASQRDHLVVELNAAIRRHNAALGEEISRTRALKDTLVARIQAEAQRLAAEQVDALRSKIRSELAAEARTRTL